jgi:hypothetical protein
VQLHRKNESRLSVSVKWGGEFTHAGRHQAKDVGEAVRSDLTLLLNPSAGEYHPLSTGNVMVHAGRERRVVATANVFAKALLGISELPVDFIRIGIPAPDETDIVRAKQIIEAVKKRMLCGRETDTQSLYDLLRNVSDSILTGGGSNECSSQSHHSWCCSDSPALFKERWERLAADILGKEPSKLDPARIFDLYDSLKYDLIHHREYLRKVAGPKLSDLVDLVQRLFNDLSARQYGESRDEQIAIARLLSGRLLRCILDDLENQKNFCFYFTKESNLHCLHTLLKHSLSLPEIGELDYLAQVELELWRRGGDGNGGGGSHGRCLRAGVKQGAHLDCLSAGFTSGGGIDDHALKVSQRRTCTDHLDYEHAVSCVDNLLHPSTTHQTNKEI